MRITRYRNMEHGHHCNIESRAHELWKDLRGSQFAMNRAQAYRETIDKVFSPSISLGYPIIAVTDNGDCLCIDCAKKVYLEERLDVTVDIYYEGPAMVCDECNEEIESAYGDPWEEENE